MINRLLISCAAMFWAGMAGAQVLECVDAKGKKEYAQTCPPGTVKENKLVKGGSSPSSTGTSGATPAAKSLAERDVDFKKRSLERRDAEAKAEKEKNDSKNAERDCYNARAQLKQLQDGMRVSRTDPNTGERTFLEDNDRPAEIANAQRGVDNACARK